MYYIQPFFATCIFSTSCCIFRTAAHGIVLTPTLFQAQHDLWPHPPRHHICASTQGSSVPSLNKIDEEIKKLAQLLQKTLDLTPTKCACTWLYSTWPFRNPTWHLTSPSSAPYNYVQVPKANASVPSKKKWCRNKEISTFQTKILTQKWCTT